MPLAQHFPWQPKIGGVDVFDPRCLSMQWLRPALPGLHTAGSTNVYRYKRRSVGRTDWKDHCRTQLRLGLAPLHTASPLMANRSLNCPIKSRT